MHEKGSNTTSELSGQDPCFVANIAQRKKTRLLSVRYKASSDFVMLYAKGNYLGEHCIQLYC